MKINVFLVFSAVSDEDLRNPNDSPNLNGPDSSVSK